MTLYLVLYLFLFIPTSGSNHLQFLCWNKVKRKFGKVYCEIYCDILRGSFFCRLNIKAATGNWLIINKHKSTEKQTSKGITRLNKDHNCALLTINMSLSTLFSLCHKNVSNFFLVIIQKFYIIKNVNVLNM